MQFISFYFIVFICFFLIGYYIVPGRFRYLFLLVCNIFFYLSWTAHIEDVISIVSVICITWLGAKVIEKTLNSKIQKCGLIATIIFTIGSLIYFKYSSFLFGNISTILSCIGININVNFKNPFMPIGISFFTFQALSYVFEVYKKKMGTEKNIFFYATYVTFFPTILSGPIERPNGLLQQIKELGQKGFEFSNVRNGIVLAIWGGYIKYVIVNRFSIIADTVFNTYDSQGMVVLVFGAICYTLQIYCDFLAYSIIAAGLGKMLGIELTENFNAPYFSRSIQEFWRRWHISLSTWFRDYVYIPLGGSRCSALRKNCNLFVTFLVSGLWHGANWTYVIWGMIHGIYQIIGNITKPYRKWIYEHFQVNQNCFSFRWGQRACTFILVAFAWIFFRADSLPTAIAYITRMISEFDIWNLFNHSIYNLGLDILQMNILFISFNILLFIDYLKYKTNKNIDTLLFEQNYLFYCAAIIILFVSTFVFGMYGPDFNAQDFIYFQF